MYFTEPLLALFEIIAIIVGVLYVRRDKLRYFFLFYIILDFIILNIDFYIIGFSNYSKNERKSFFGVSNILISYAELSVYYFYFSKTLQSIKIKIFMKISFVFFSLVILMFLTNNLQFLNLDNADIYTSIGALEFLLIIPVCLTYFLELFDNPTTNLFQRPSFWIATGIFFYAVISVPYYLFNNSLISNVSIFSKMGSLLFYLPFAINFMFLTKAFLCKKQLTI